MNTAIQTLGDYMRLKGLTPDWAALQRADAFMNQPVHDLSDFKFAETAYTAYEGSCTMYQVRFVKPSAALFERLAKIGLRSLVYLADGLYIVTRKEGQIDGVFFEFSYHRLAVPIIPTVYGRANLRPQ